MKIDVWVMMVLLVVLTVSVVISVYKLIKHMELYRIEVIHLKNGETLDVFDVKAMNSTSAVVKVSRKVEKYADLTMYEFKCRRMKNGVMNEC